MRFSVGDWLTQLAFETIGEEARAARRVVPENAASLDAAPEQPAQDPTETDQELFNFTSLTKCCGWRIWSATARRPIPDRPSTATKRRCACTAHFPHCPRSGDRSSIGPASRTGGGDTAALIGIREDEVATIAAAARGFLRARLREAGLAVPIAEDDCVDSRSPAQCACPCRSTSAAAWLPP
jgi:hypothetical protein